MAKATKAGSCLRLFFDETEHFGEDLPLSEVKKKISFWWTPASGICDALVYYRLVSQEADYHYMVFNVRNADLNTGDVIVPYRAPNTPGSYTMQLYRQTFTGPISGVASHNDVEGVELLGWLNKVCELTFEVTAGPEKVQTSSKRKSPAVTTQYKINVGDKFSENDQGETYHYEVAKVEEKPLRFWADLLPEKKYQDEFRSTGMNIWHRVGAESAWNADIYWE